MHIGYCSSLSVMRFDLFCATMSLICQCHRFGLFNSLNLKQEVVQHLIFPCKVEVKCSINKHHYVLHVLHSTIYSSEL